MDAFEMAMKARGFSPQTVRVLRRLKCPICNFEFSIVYARATSCQGCRKAAMKCPLVRCPKCDTEFNIRDLRVIKIGKKLIKTEAAERKVATHMSNFLKYYYKQLGWKFGP